MAVGILVDDATVTIENIDRHLAEGKPTLDAIRDGAAPARSLALLNLPTIVRNLVGLKSVNDSVRPGIAGALSKAPSAFSSAGWSNRPNIRTIASSGPSPNQLWYG